MNFKTHTVIEEANWLTIYDDIKHLIGEGFDAVICLGNSFAHMLDAFGDQREQKLAIQNFERCVKPGGLLLIDHRNYDNIMDTGSTPAKSIYYNVSATKHTHTLPRILMAFTVIRTKRNTRVSTRAIINIFYIFIYTFNERQHFAPSHFSLSLSLFLLFRPITEQTYD